MMKVIVLVKATKDSESGKMPSERAFREMGNFNEELVKAGVMLAGEGLHPSSKGKRMVFKGGTRSFTEGPFSETKDLVSGFWIWQVKSMEEALEWARRIPNPDNTDGEFEIRPVFTEEDFGAALTPELKEQADRLRAQTEGGKARS
ncbi:MAG TPA: YciI family protein [Polyangiaceae bacterium]|nr:YciI family protein [Polyangiaceae bacterium]